MATCGNCKATGTTVDHIRACYAGKGGTVTLERPTVAPQAPAAPRVRTDIPAASYALQGADTAWRFYSVEHGKPGTRWDGFVFVSQLVGGGSDGGWKRYPVKGAARDAVLQGIAAMGVLESAQAYGREHGVCGVCNRALSDPESIAAGIGPVCAGRLS